MRGLHIVDLIWISVVRAGCPDIEVRRLSTSRTWAFPCCDHKAITRHISAEKGYTEMFQTITPTKITIAEPPPWHPP